MIAESRALEMITAARKAGRPLLTEPESKALLAWAGIPVPRGAVARSPDEAAAIAHQLGTPVAVKVVSPDLAHKSDLGGVILPVPPDAAADAYRRVLAAVAVARPTARIDGVLVEEARSGGVECVLGLTTGTPLGPTVMFGLGGLFVEALQEVSFRLVPLLPEDAQELIGEVRGARCLDGFRGSPPASKAALARAILDLARLAEQPELGRVIREVDVNPLLAGPEGVVALDALIVLNDNPEGARDA